MSDPEEPQHLCSRLNGILYELRTQHLTPEMPDSHILKRCYSEIQWACTAASELRTWGKAGWVKAKREL